MVGNRVFDSLAVLDETMQLVWGPEGVNVEKMAEEGEPSTTQLLWGLHMNFDTQEVRLPEPKRIKAKYLLGEAALQRGLPRSSPSPFAGTDWLRPVLDRGMPSSYSASSHLVPPP